VSSLIGGIESHRTTPEGGLTQFLHSSFEFDQQARQTL